MDKKLCGGGNGPPLPPLPAGVLDAPAASRSEGARTYMKGPKGGCYYVNRSGKKTYVDKEKCNPEVPDLSGN